MVQRLLGMDHGDAISGVKFNSVYLRKWIKNNRLGEKADDEVVRCHPRAVILLLLGGQYLSDKTGNRVKLRYLPFLENLDTCKEYSWGFAILATIYRELCYASSGNDKISGPLSLLQNWAWISFHLLDLRKSWRCQIYPSFMTIHYLFILTGGDGKQLPSIMIRKWLGIEQDLF